MSYVFKDREYGRMQIFRGVEPVQSYLMRRVS